MSTLTQTRKELTAYLRRNPHLAANGRPIMKNLAILASDADDQAKDDALRVLPDNVKRFEAARDGAKSNV